MQPACGSDSFRGPVARKSRQPAYPAARQRWTLLGRTIGAGHWRSKLAFLPTHQRRANRRNHAVALELRGDTFKKAVELAAAAVCARLISRACTLQRRVTSVP